MAYIYLTVLEDDTNDPPGEEKSEMTRRIIGKFAGIICDDHGALLQCYWLTDSVENMLQQRELILQ